MMILGGHGGGRKGEGEGGRKVRTGMGRQGGMPAFFFPSSVVDDTKRCIIQVDSLLGTQLSARTLTGRWK